jgi:phosphoglycerol transferase MdoB-like AlkP superfamily enzyme
MKAVVFILKLIVKGFVVLIMLPALLVAGLVLTVLLPKGVREEYLGSLFSEMTVGLWRKLVTGPEKVQVVNWHNRKKRRRK